MLNHFFVGKERFLCCQSTGLQVLSGGTAASAALVAGVSMVSILQAGD